MPSDLHYDKLGEIHIELSDLLTDYKIPVLELSHRLKNHQHLKRKREPLDVKNITELLLIVPSIEDCYRAADIIISHLDVVKKADYIDKPWGTGYQSIHLNYRHDDESEAQLEIRTIEMHAHALELIAQYGPRFWENPDFQKYRE